MGAGLSVGGPSPVYAGPMPAYEFDGALTMSSAEEAKFRADHGLTADEDLRPHIAREAQARLRAAGLFGEAAVDVEPLD